MSFRKFNFKKIFIVCMFVCLQTISFSAFAQNIAPKNSSIHIPKDTTWTERFIFSELQGLRTQQDRLKREIYQEVHDMELTLTDRALSYSGHTLNFFFVFLSIMIMGVGVIGWKTVGDIKMTLRSNMEKESKRILQGFQKKMDSIERDQEINILWRNLSLAERSQDKIDILKEIRELNPESIEVLIEKSNVYLEMELFDKVIETCDEVLEKGTDIPQIIFNRSVAYVSQGMKKEALSDIEHLLKISPDYRDIIFEKEALQSLEKDIKKMIES